MKDKFFDYLVATDQLDDFLGNKVIQVYQSENNNYIKMRVIGRYKYLGGLDQIDLTNGKIYYRVGTDNEFRIVDDSEEDYLFLEEYFEKVN